MAAGSADGRHRERAWRARLSTLPADGAAQLAVAVMLTLAAVGVRLAVALRAEPGLAFMPIVVAIGAALLFFLGGALWLIVRLVQFWVESRVRAEAHRPVSRAERIWVVAVVLFLSVPELVEAVRFWHEHLLRHLPGEEAAIERFRHWYVVNHDAIVGVTIIAAIGCMVFWKLFRNFRRRLRAAVKLIGQLFVGRHWSFPGFIAVCMAATMIALLRFGGIGFGVTLSVEFLVLVVWLFLPAIVPNLIWLLPALACIGPALIVSARVKSGGPAPYVAILVAWAMWLFSIVVAPGGDSAAVYGASANGPTARARGQIVSARAWRIWRIPYWLGVLAFVAYLVVGAG